MRLKKKYVMLRILKSGLHTSVQDTGRQNYRNSGVPVSGAMDNFSAVLANQLLGNNEQDAVLENTLVGPVVEFLENTVIALSGAITHAQINGTTVHMKTPISINKGDVLSLEKIEKGMRCYLAVKGGFQTESVLESRSFYEAVTGLSALKKNQKIPFHPFKEFQASSSIIKADDSFLFNQNIEVFKGPEFDWLTPQDKEILFNNTFHLSERQNRMAVFLQETLRKNNRQIITCPTLPGTVQLTPSGQLMLLMRDAQTTGGYPRILQLSERGINCLAQKKPSEKVRFILL